MSSACQYTMMEPSDSYIWKEKEKTNGTRKVAKLPQPCAPPLPKREQQCSGYAALSPAATPATSPSQCCERCSPRAGEHLTWMPF